MTPTASGSRQPARAIRTGIYARVGAGARSRAAAPRISGYQLQRQVGRGRMSTAWLAQDLRRGGEVVLKILDAAHTGGAAQEVSFAQEFAIALQIHHKHVMRVFDQGVEGSHTYIAMEYVDGGDVAGLIRHGITAAESLTLLRQAALALAQLHQRGLVHRDVKPANLLLRATGELVLADFGMACRAGEASAAPQGTVIGTPCYAAPEQMQGQAATPAADVYGLGVVFHEMLCGTPPFTGPSALELQCQHLMAAVPRLPLAHARLQPFVDAMLEKDAQRRLADADAVLREIDLIQSRQACAPGAHGATPDRCPS